MTPQRNKHNSSVCTLLLLNTISIITYEAQLYQRPRQDTWAPAGGGKRRPSPPPWKKKEKKEKKRKKRRKKEKLKKFLKEKNVQTKFLAAKGPIVCYARKFPHKRPHVMC